MFYLDRLNYSDHSRGCVRVCTCINCSLYLHRPNGYGPEKIRCSFFVFLGHLWRVYILGHELLTHKNMVCINACIYSGPSKNDEPARPLYTVLWWRPTPRSPYISRDNLQVQFLLSAGIMIRWKFYLFDRWGKNYAFL